MARRRTPVLDPEPVDPQWAEWSEPAADSLPDDDDYDDEHLIPPRRRGRGFLVFLTVLAILAAVALFGVRYVQRQIDPPGPPGVTVALVIPTGSSTSRIAALLHKEKVIGNPTMFRYYAQVKGKGNFEAGKYEFRRNDSFDNTIAVLLKGPKVPDSLKVTIPEGFRLDQIAARVANQAEGHTKEKFLAAAGSGQVRSEYSPVGNSNLEGLLFPETYKISLEEDDIEVIRRMVESFDEQATEAGAADSQSLVGVTPYEAIIVASMVEREAKIEDDRGKIARVIYNRLKTKTALQVDATVIYAKGGDTETLTLADLEIDSPYNTYKVKGLPPTPIAMPGRASIDAALHPTEGDWLYYVVTGEDGSHSFANTFKEHKANIKIAKQKGLR